MPHRLAAPILVVAALLLPAGAANAARWTASLDGGQEVPPNASPATGIGTLSLDGDLLTVEVRWFNLSAPITIAHIHCCAPVGANAPIALDFEPPEVGPDLSGSFSRVFNLGLSSTYNPGFLISSGGAVAAARLRLLSAFDNELAYFNLHTSSLPAGEIRGQIDVVPEPGSWALMIAGFGLCGLAMRRRRGALPSRPD